MSRRKELALRFGSLNAKPHGKGSLRAAIMHNRRELPHENQPGRDGLYDSAKSHLNRRLHGCPETTDDAMELHRRLISAAGYRLPRRDATVAVEGVFSFADTQRDVDMMAFFSECAAWLVRRFGGVLLSADVHLDQGNPHCHVIVALPLRDGAPPGSEMIGDGSAIRDHTADFAQSVAIPAGIAVNPTVSKTHAERLRVEICKYLSVLDDSARAGAFQRIAADLIDSQPLKVAQALGIDESRPRVRTLERLSMSTGRGPRTRQAERRSDQRLEAAWERQAGSRQTESETWTESAPLAPATPDTIRPAQAQTPTVGVEATTSPQSEEGEVVSAAIVVREDLLPSGLWDCERGEFVHAEPAHHGARAKADAWVSSGLAKLRMSRQPARHGQPVGVPEPA